MVRVKLAWVNLHAEDGVGVGQATHCRQNHLQAPVPVRQQELFRKGFLQLSALQSSGAVCESGGGRPGLPIPDSPYGLCGRKATLTLNSKLLCFGFGFDPPL